MYQKVRVGLRNKEKVTGMLIFSPKPYYMNIPSIKRMVEQGRINYDHLEQDVKLDVKDKRILMLLAENSRMPLTQIAKKVKLSRDAINYRIKRMEEKGVIIKFFPSLNYAKLGYYLFHVFVLMDELDTKEQDKLINHLVIHSHVESVLEYNDRWDLEIVFIAKDLLEFDSIILGITEKFSHVVIEKDKVEIIKRYKSQYIPPLIEKIKQPFEKVPEMRLDKVHIDKKDLKLLRLLSGNARASTYELGKNLGMSPDTVTYRMKKLIKERVIRKFTLLINYSLLNYNWYTYTVELKVFSRKNEQRFEEFLRQHPHIVRAAKTIGGWDLLMYIIADHPTRYHQVIKSIKRDFSDVIKNYEAWIAYKEHIYNPMPKCIDRVVLKEKR
jgi:DNA-binding Lrp family transcriptional regulator